MQMHRKTYPLERVLHMVVIQCFLRNSISVRSQDSLMRGEAFGQMFACLFTANPIDRVAQRVGFPIGKRDVWTLMFAHRSV